MAYAPAGNVTGSGGMRHLAAKYYSRKALDQLKAKFRFLLATEPDVLPLRNGRSVQWFRYSLLGANVTPSSEGTVGAGLALDTAVVSATVSEYSDFITLSQLLVDTAIDPIMANAAEQLGYRAGLTVDTVVRTEFDVNIASVTQATIGSNLATNDLRKAKALLEGKNVAPRDGDSFLCIVHPYCLYDIVAETAVGSFVDVSKYAQPDTLLSGEVGKISGVRIIASTNVGDDGVAPTTKKYYTYVVGKGAVGAVDLAGSGPSKVQDPSKQSFKINTIEGKPQIADPEGVVGGAVSYRFVFAAKTLDSVNFRYQIIPSDSSIV